MNLLIYPGRDSQISMAHARITGRESRTNYREIKTGIDPFFNISSIHYKKEN